MTFQQLQRLIFIDAMLANVRVLRRSDLQEALGISAAQASLDMRLFRKLYGETLTYCPSQKGYLRGNRPNVWDDIIHQPVQAGVRMVHIAADVLIENADG